MDANNKEYERYQHAQKQVEAIKGFYGHLASFVVIMLFFLFLNLKYTPKYLWFFWPMLGWGIGLLFHGMKVFNFIPFLGKDWEQRKIKEYMEEDQKMNNKFE